MNATDKLVEQLAAQGPPRHRRNLPRFVASLVLAWIAGLLVLWAVLGEPSPALSQAGSAAIIMKLAFAFSVALLAGAITYTTAIPGRSISSLAVLAAMPFGAVVFLTVLEIGTGNIALGSTLARCITAIVSLWPVGFATALFSLRCLAPTTPRVASASASLTGAALAASAYGFWCPENGSTFLLLGYALPVALLTIVGLTIGPRFLRW